VQAHGLRRFRPEGSGDREPAPSGAWLMEDFHIAGGIRGLAEAVEGMLHLEAAR
jgi:hypothetical protein